MKKAERFLLQKTAAVIVIALCLFTAFWGFFPGHFLKAKGMVISRFAGEDFQVIYAREGMDRVKDICGHWFVRSGIAFTCTATRADTVDHFGRAAFQDEMVIFVYRNEQDAIKNESPLYAYYSVFRYFERPHPSM